MTFDITTMARSEPERVEQPWIETAAGLLVIDVSYSKDFLHNVCGDKPMSYGKWSGARHAVTWREVRHLLQRIVAGDEDVSRLRECLRSAYEGLDDPRPYEPVQLGYLFGTKVLVDTIFAETPRTVRAAVHSFCRARAAGTGGRAIKFHFTYAKARRVLAQWLASAEKTTRWAPLLRELTTRGYSRERAADCLLVVATAISGPPSAAVASLATICAGSVDRNVTTWTARSLTSEVLRISPPVALMQRSARAESSIDGRRVAVGDAVYISPYLAHHRRSAWPQPFDFSPRRWNKSAPRGLYYPYGFSGASCLGVHLSTVVLETIAGSWLAGDLRFEHVAPVREPVTPHPPFHYRDDGKLKVSRAAVGQQR